MGLSAIDIVYMADFALSYERFRNMTEWQNYSTGYDEFHSCEALLRKIHTKFTNQCYTASKEVNCHEANTCR